MARALICLPFLVVCLVGPTRTRAAQGDDTPFFLVRRPRSLAEHFAQALNDIRTGRQLRAQFNYMTRDARQRFWANYPNGPEFARATDSIAGAHDQETYGVKDAEEPSLAAMTTFKPAIDASWPPYAEYLVSRDLEEFRLAGKLPPGRDPFLWQLTISSSTSSRGSSTAPRGTRNRDARSHTYDSYPRARRYYDTVVQLFGADYTIISSNGE